MKILLTGSKGQLGRELAKTLPKDYCLKAINRNDLDLNNLDECYNYVIKFKPDWLVNCAAYTDVEGSEKNSEKAFRINSYAPKYFAKALKETGGKMLQMSTDYVFDGEKHSPYKINDEMNPQNVYGESKAMAEIFIQESLKSNNQFHIVRTSWVLSSKGKNFLNTMLKLLPNKKVLSVVRDQYGCITSTKSLSKVCWELIKKSSNCFDSNIPPKKLHWCEAGILNWYQLALTVREFIINNNIFNDVADIKSVLSDEYKSKVKRPKYSVLNCLETEKFLEIKQIPWKESLNEIFQEVLCDIDERK